jgi:hypothetical protein
MRIYHENQHEIHNNVPSPDPNAQPKGFPNRWNCNKPTQNSNSTRSKFEKPRADCTTRAAQKAPFGTPIGPEMVNLRLQQLLFCTGAVFRAHDHQLFCTGAVFGACHGRPKRAIFVSAVVGTSVSSTTNSLSQIQLATVHGHKPHVDVEDCGRMFPAPKCYELPEAA